MKLPRIIHVILTAVIAIPGIAVASPAEARSRPGVMVSWNPSYGNGPIKIKPKTIIGWESWGLTSLRWTRLTDTAGTAKGILTAPVACNDDACEPTFTQTRVTVTFSSVRNHGGKLAFTKVVARDSQDRITTFHLPRDLH